MGYRDEVPFNELFGKTIVHIEGCVAESDEVKFLCDDGTEYVMFHDQDCCETVRLYDVTGDVAALLHTPITQARVSTNDDERPHEFSESYTWTFYDLATVRGHVQLRWLGESNGYYSESVSFERDPS